MRAKPQAAQQHFLNSIMTSSFESQLQATRANLERLEALAAAAQDLFAHASLIQINDEGSRVYIHASQVPEYDWLALAVKYARANWQREHSPAIYGKYDWTGVIDGVEVSILGAEARELPKPLFAESAVVA
ncbi:MAG: hypothetical protein V4563_15925 [Pseudomonadota bacterium]